MVRLLIFTIYRLYHACSMLPPYKWKKSWVNLTAHHVVQYLGLAALPLG